MANDSRFKIAASQRIIKQLLDSKVMKEVDFHVQNGILFTDDRVAFSRHIADALIDVSKKHPDESIVFSYSDESTLFEVVSYYELINGTIRDLDRDIGREH